MKICKGSDIVNAKQYLNQIKRLDTQINNKQIELEQLRVMSKSITGIDYSSDKVQSTGSKDKLGDIVAKFVDKQNEINKLIDKFVDVKQEAINVIEQVSDVDEYNILHKRYVQYMTFDAIATSIIKKNGERMTYQWVCELHKRALIKVQQILDS